MNKIALVWPAAALALLTFITLVVVGLRRSNAVKSGKLPVDYFRTYQGAEPPDDAVQAARHYENLFELPVLFYALVAILIAIPFFDVVLLALGWAFVLMRYAHATVHLGSNNVRLRFRTFTAGAALLLAMWVYAAVKLMLRGAPLL
ncbi:MAG: hypothetical protein JWM77_1299 [Rhodospirillales bacterium]|nr:hypothetical protein [Rhodospirillales bacterium]